MSYKPNLYDPERAKAEAAMRVRERTKDAAYESFGLLERVLSEAEREKGLDFSVISADTVLALRAHVKKVRGES